MDQQYRHGSIFIIVSVHIIEFQQRGAAFDSRQTTRKAFRYHSKPWRSAMHYTMMTADQGTHVRIVAVALVMSIALACIGITRQG